jgi:eukaryotic-like serine/threonine-protein kinase
MSADFRRVGKYELRERLASGGQGEVWKAFDLQLRRFVAIKQLNAHLQEDPDFVARFEREAQFIAALRHPNIVRIHDFQFVSTPESKSPTAYMVMDYIEGPTLADYIRNTSRKGQLPSGSDIVSIFTSISLALDYAHQKGMIHRDIKPANIMLDKRNPNGKTMGEPVLMDFGIAKLQGGNAEATNVLGTPLYISPEQAQGLASSPRSDLYSLGIILYEIMTGVTPFRGESMMVILLKHYQEIPTPPALINPDISPALSRVILQSIAKDPSARFSSASAMTSALAEAFNIPLPPDLGKMMVPRNEQDASNLSAYAPEMAFLAPSSSYYPPSSVNAAPLIFDAAAHNKYISADGRGEVSASLAPILPQAPKRARKSLIIASIVLLALLGIGIASYALFIPKSTGSSATSVGHIHFLNSQNKAGTLDMVQITLQGLQDAPDGKHYYAWFETHDDNIPPIHWSFTAHNGSLSPSSYTNSNLLTSQPYRMLITIQSGDTIAPSIDLSARLYYVLLPQTIDKNTTFDMLACPQSASDQTCA